MRSRFALPLGLAAAALASGAGAQGTKADFARSARLEQLTRGKVFRDRVEPHWLDEEHFWCRVALPGGKHETWLVEARTGRKSPYEPAGGAASEGLSARFPGPGFRSRENGEETEIVLVNRTATAVRIFWADLRGERREYGSVPPGAERRLHTYAGHAWVVTAEDGRPLAGFIAEAGGGRAVITGPVAAPPGAESPPPGAGRQRARRLSPDGKWRARVLDYNLVLRQEDGGEELPLTKDGSAEDHYSEEELFWSPDSTRLAALKTLKGQEHKVYFVESSPSDQLQPKLHWIDYLKPGDRIPQEKPHLFDVLGRKEIPVPDRLFPNPWSVSHVRWAPDSSRFTFLYNERGHQVLRVIAVDAATGEPRAIVDEQSRTFIDYNGKSFYRLLDDTGEILWMSERDGWNHLYLYDAKSGRVKNPITRGQWVVRGVDRVDPVKRQIWFRAGGIWPGQDPYYVHYCRVSFDGTGLVKLTEGDGTHSVEYSPGRRYLIDTWSRVDLPPVTELRSAEDGRLISLLERADASRLLAAGWKAPVRFTAKGRDGVTDVYGVIFRPMRIDPRRKYPVLEDLYAGPQDSFVPKTFRPYYRQQALAELGFIVVKIDGMGTSNRSKAFHDLCWRNLGDAGLLDRILWMKAAARTRRWMDLSRVGVYGVSAGAQSALRALLVHPEFYKVGVSACGCHDNRMDKIWWNELWMGWPVGPWYAEQSNVTQAHRLQGKLLLIVGEMDTNVDPASTMQVVNALVKADKEFDLLVVPGAGHGMGGAYGERRMRSFFVRHLLHKETPPKPEGQ
jgi:dipeptidyl-peptidase-4